MEVVGQSQRLDASPHYTRRHDPKKLQCMYTAVNCCVLEKPGLGLLKTKLLKKE
jgi:hypothetical protein